MTEKSDHIPRHDTRTSILSSARAAFPLTLPIAFAWFFLGLSYGLLMESKGFPHWYTALMATVIFAGSLEFVTVDLLLSVFNPLLAFLMALMVNARFLFYGLAMLTKYRGTGLKKWYLIFGLTDETFAVNSSLEISERDAARGASRGWVYFFVTFFSHGYWVLSSLFGSLIGASLPFSTRGIDFVLTAMFVTIFLDEWLKTRRHSSAAIGVLVSLGCLLIFGPNAFLIPTMLGMLAIFSVLYWRRSASSASSANSSSSSKDLLS
ncbi:AzlC family ABC transporter permease [Alloscardovia macacae]|uniref:AzlC family ABC transporter permease n=1 Tax=Alloscardovia macacae TaxID=1160091 RepID=UPI00214D49C2|nr:AzlC family ABC transporter permease [Alloscardovia macacae]